MSDPFEVCTRLVLALGGIPTGTLVGGWRDSVVDFFICFLVYCAAVICFAFSVAFFICFLVHCTAVKYFAFSGSGILLISTTVGVGFSLYFSELYRVEQTN